MGGAKCEGTGADARQNDRIQGRKTLDAYLMPHQDAQFSVANATLNIATYARTCWAGSIFGTKSSPETSKNPLKALSLHHESRFSQSLLQLDLGLGLLISITCVAQRARGWAESIFGTKLLSLRA